MRRASFACATGLDMGSLKDEAAPQATNFRLRRAPVSAIRGRAGLLSHGTSVRRASRGGFSPGRTNNIASAQPRRHPRKFILGCGSSLRRGARAEPRRDLDRRVVGWAVSGMADFSRPVPDDAAAVAFGQRQSASGPRAADILLRPTRHFAYSLRVTSGD